MAAQKPVKKSMFGVIKAPKIDPKENLDWQTIDQKRSIIMPKLGESLKAGDEGGLKKHPLLIRNKVLMDEVEREVDKVRGKGFWKNLPK